MRVLTYNIENGCNQREDILFNYLKEVNCDIAGLNELNDWTQNKLEYYADKYGFKYCYITKNQKSRYKIGYVSKVEFDDLIEHTEKFHHAALHIKIKDMNIIVIHLTPHDSIQRKKECQEIVSMCSNLDGKILIMGDFNSLSIADQIYYDNSYLEKFLSNEKLTRKFLSEQKKINYKPIDILLNNGFQDLSNTNFFDFTVPTERKVDSMHTLPLRLDYIFGKNVEVVKSAYTDKNEITHKLSDHYPVIAEIL